MIGAIKADTLSADTKVFTLMWIERMLVYCDSFTKLTRSDWKGLVFAANLMVLSPVYTAQTNPGSTRVKTNPGCVYTTLFQTNPGRTRVSSVYTTN